jgi:lysophospholipase L1-like esterase
MVAANISRFLSRQRVVSEALLGQRQIAFLGDSITEAFSTVGAPAWTRFIAPMGAANLGAGGATAPEVLWMLRAGLLANVRPNIVVLEIGTNDLALGTTPRETAINVLNILRELRRQLPEAQIVVVGVLPLGDPPDASIRRDGDEYNQLLARWAPALGAMFVDPGPLFRAVDRFVAEDLLSDGVHPTATGYEVYSHVVLPAIAAALANAQQRLA